MKVESLNMAANVGGVVVDVDVDVVAVARALFDADAFSVLRLEPLPRRPPCDLAARAAGDENDEADDDDDGAGGEEEGNADGSAADAGDGDDGDDDDEGRRKLNRPVFAGSLAGGSVDGCDAKDGEGNTGAKFANENAGLDAAAEADAEPDAAAAGEENADLPKLAWSAPPREWKLSPLIMQSAYTSILWRASRNASAIVCKYRVLTSRRKTVSGSRLAVSNELQRQIFRRTMKKSGRKLRGGEMHCEQTKINALLDPNNLNKYVETND